MSDQHTQGKIEAFTEESFSGWWALRLLHPNVNSSAHELGSGDGGFDEHDARRLAAAWNACEGLSTEGVEMIAEHGGMFQAGANRIAIEAELAAARALLREVMQSFQEHDGGGIFDHEKLRIRSYLDASDKQGGA